ncbi:pyridine nucleotide-disulfide oxidoreductase [Plantibacter sp. Leaf171]|uniref:NAD(P)/FAD-dependent oxidoreductase n=1 Tax=unclassified Plantibacter TaxID=2624265 RepID=UPI0006FE292F|nr:MULTISPECIES: NAD(P)/FAD-dependent oxidoreductase [unclassified Plantibacter]KQM15479.1 pyridine nucleotide-disulfide oxidoreductase [Plantibacter sp. Leaf1]KQR58623.1 pyridine nucleotide-disulfide oxidoreductase [Plantibacter sp. Leaf171]
MNDAYDVVVIGGGPAGLSAALNLARARRRVLVLDGNRPRHAATLRSHGFLTRDGVPPLDLRRLGREEVAAYGNAEIQFAAVQTVEATPDGFRVVAQGVRGEPDRDVVTRTVVVASGLTETLPKVGNMRAFYGTDLHSCVECDGFEKADAPLALIGESADLAEWAILIAQWSSDLIVFTNGSDTVTEPEEAALASAGIRVERGAVAELAGGRDGFSGVMLADGTLIERSGGFVRPEWSAPLEYLLPLALDRDTDGYVVVDAWGRTTVPGVYAAGDITPPGPQQLIVAAGNGARVARALNRDLAGVPS